MPSSIPVFLNGHPHVVTVGTTALQLLRAVDPDLARLAATDGVTATDGRGIAVALDAVLGAGSILRVFRSARRTGDTHDA